VVYLEWYSPDLEIYSRYAIASGMVLTSLDSLIQSRLRDRAASSWDVLCYFIVIYVLHLYTSVVTRTIVVFFLTIRHFDQILMDINENCR
jgi:uncharacterized membrane protein YhaH (DUF805 family)